MTRAATFPPQKALALFFYAKLMRLRPAPLTVSIKRLLRIQRVWAETLRGRFLVDPVSYFGLEVLRFGVYEPEMTQAIETLLEAGDVFVDLGANEGYFSVTGSRRVGPRGRVLAIEPQARARAVLEGNLRANGCGNVSVESRAISGRSGSELLHLSPDTNTGATSFTAMRKYGVPTERVSTATLSEVLKAHRVERIDLLKIDVEGAEHEIILGAREIFTERRVRRIALEIHPMHLARRGLDPKQLLEFLETCHYQPLPRFPNLVLSANAE